MTTGLLPTDTPENRARAAAVSAAMRVMQAHIDGINARDQDAIAATLHFPHYRLVGSTLMVWKSMDSLSGRLSETRW